MIYLSQAAQARIRRFVAKQAGAIGVRVAVKRSGCSGYGYDIDVIDAAAPQDKLFDYGDFQVAVAESDLPLLMNVQIDVKKNGLNESFSFDNPQAQATCGCGTSFSI